MKSTSTTLGCELYPIVSFQEEEEEEGEEEGENGKQIILNESSLRIFLHSSFFLSFLSLSLSKEEFTENQKEEKGRTRKRGKERKKKKDEDDEALKVSS